MNPAERILRTLAKHLRGPADVRLFGGAALILAYGLDRTTEDADLLHEDSEVEALVENAGFGEALEATNRELEPEGLYLTHIWGPEQQILTPEWKAACRPLPARFGPRLSVSVLGPLDLVLSKLCRLDDGDLADVRWLVAREGIGREALQSALARARVPRDFVEVFAENRERVLAVFDS